MTETLEPNKTYLPTHIEVNRPELLRLQSDIEDLMTEAAKLYARLNNLIKQGTTPRKEKECK
jgi:hypothetical protein